MNLRPHQCHLLADAQTTVSRAAEGQQTPEIEPTQSCANQLPETRRPPSIERLRVNRRQSLLPWNMPVTPEVAGSSPVAPVKSLQIGMSCCL
jgi:hypothetical protein